MGCDYIRCSTRSPFRSTPLLFDTKDILVYLNAHIHMILIYIIAGELLEAATQDT